MQSDCPFFVVLQCPVNRKQSTATTQSELRISSGRGINIYNLVVNNSGSIEYSVQCGKNSHRSTIVMFALVIHL